MSSSWDMVIAGAGLAGLSLAAELTAPEFSHLRILLVEPREAYARDRTWSFWNTPDALPKRWQQLEQTHWKQWRVSSGHRSVTRCGQYGYSSVRADAFYEHALKLIAAAPNIEWCRQTSLRRMNVKQEGLELTTSQGEQLQTQWLMDSRPPDAAAAGQWVQQFKGWEVHAAQACFDANCLDLMAFEPSDKGLHFIYCLPYSETQALVESTWIMRADASAIADSELRQALSLRWQCNDFEIGFKEQGALPLLPTLQVDSDRVIRIGRAGGALRASTGYAFCTTLHRNAELADSLKAHLHQQKSVQGWRAPRVASTGLDRWMDETLFRALEQDWQKAPRYFVDMFERVEPDALVRFLQGASSWQDRWAVMRALPTAPFARAAIGRK